MIRRSALKGNGLSLLAGVCALYLLLGLAYSLLVPVWEAPDEPLHYRYALLLAREGRQPSNAENSESFQPPSYYFLAGLALRWLDQNDPNLVQFYSPGVVQNDLYRFIAWDRSNYRWVWGAMVLRWANLALGSGTLALIFFGVRRAFPKTPSIWAGVLLWVGLMPQFLHNSTSVSNDPLAIFTGALLFWLTIRMLHADFGPPALIAIGFFALALPLATKLTVLPAGLAAAGAAAWRLRSRWPAKKIFRPLVGGALVLLAVLAAGFLFFPTAFRNAWLEMAWRLTFVRSNLLETPVWQTLYVYAWSFWGRLGWRDVGLPIPIVVMLSVFAFTGLWFSIRRFPWRGGDPGSAFPERPVWVYLWACLAAAGLVLLRNYFTSAQAQGRFLFPVIAPIAVLAVSGWHAAMVPGYRRWIPSVIAWVMLALNLYLLLGRVIPLYYQPFLDGV